VLAVFHYAVVHVVLISVHVSYEQKQLMPITIASRPMVDTRRQPLGFVGRITGGRGNCSILQGIYARPAATPGAYHAGVHPARGVRQA
jgi:hypothetical protein